MGSIGGISPGGSIALGIVVGLLSTGVQSLGLTLQRKSHILEDEKGPYDVRRPPYRRRRWQLGMGMFVISNVLGSSVQISTLPLPVLSTLQASGLVFNSICATLILGEPFTRWSLWGTLLVCTGAVLIAIFGAIPSPAHSLNELLELLSGRPFVVWMSFQIIIVLGIAVGTEAVSNMTTLMQHARYRLARGFAYGCLSGILSAHSLLVAKSAVELIVRTISDGDNQFVHWQSWLLVLGLVTLALSQLYYLHRGLKLVSTSVLYPLIFCIYNIVAILDGLIYFRQTDLINAVRGCLIALGTVILLSGVLALSWRLSDEQHTPGVGQSTLAPGLGLVEDTDGEEDEEDVLLGFDICDSENAPLHYAYETFGSTPTDATANQSLAAHTPSRHKSFTPSRASTSRWTERAEIWEALEDRETPESPLPARNRRRSSTMPTSESVPLFSSSRGVSGSSSRPPGSAGGGSGGLPSRPERDFRRRRKSMGFPGFKARRTWRQSPGSGLHDAISGAWRARWWSRLGRATQREATSPVQGDGASSTWPHRAPVETTVGARDGVMGESQAREDELLHKDSLDETRPLG